MSLIIDLSENNDQVMKGIHNASGNVFYIRAFNKTKNIIITLLVDGEREEVRFTRVKKENCLFDSSGNIVAEKVIG